MESWKRTLINFLGVMTTAATLIIIYFVLFMTGVIKSIDEHIITEFLIVLVLITSVKTFWYSSIESTYYTSEEYTESIKTVSIDIDETITDANDFDTFIEYENINNYNKVVLAYCEGLTIANYRYRWFDYVERFIRFVICKPKDKLYYTSKYIHRVERRASRIHKLSSANILSFSTTRYGLTDDRNPVRRAKFWYIVSGIIISTVLTFITAMLSFSPNPDTDKRAALIKFISYGIQIMYAILQTILNASSTVRRGTKAYCNNIVTILDKYRSYQKTHKIPVLICYKEELLNASVVNNTATETTRNVDSIIE